MGPEKRREQIDISQACKLPGIRGMFCNILKQKNPAGCFLLEAANLEINEPGASLESLKLGIVSATDCPRLQEINNNIDLEIARRNTVPSS